MRYIFLFSLLLLMGCGKNEFTLDFELSSDVTDNYNVTYYATDEKGGITVQAVASIREGKCELKGLTKKPTLVFITERRSTIPMVLLANKGEKIEISGMDKNPLTWDVNGSEINSTLSEWRTDNYKILKENESDSVNIAVKNFVENNLESPVSTILMLCYYHRNHDEREYVSLMNSLKKDAKSPELLSLIGRSDQMIHSYSYPASLESIVMRAEENGRDTLYINHKNPVLFYFWQTGDENRKDIIDSIKALKKEFPDSSILIADICLDVDSVGWRNAIKKDSLEKIKRFWAPAGLVDYKIQKLKVDAIPYFIVFDMDGHQSYRGKDITEALKDYRELFNASDSVDSSD